MQSSSVFAWMALFLSIGAIRMEQRASPPAETLAERQLAPGDRLHISFAQRPDWDTDVRLASDGSVAMPQFGLVHLGGLDRVFAEAYLARRLLASGAANVARVDIRVVQSGTRRLAAVSR